MRGYWIIILFLVGLAGCHTPTVGYLQTEHAKYVPDTMIIRKKLDPVKDAYRIEYGAPWVSPKLQGLAGTAPIKYEIIEVTSAEGNAVLFRNLLKIRGAGRMELLTNAEIPEGRYVVSVGVSNEGYSEVVEKAFTFIVE